MDSHEHFTRLWTQTQPVVAGYLHAMVPDPNDAEDLLQDVAVVLLRKFGAYDAKRPFAAWALGMAKTQMLARRRDAARSFVERNQDLVEKVTTAYAELSPELDERAAALRDCVQKVEGRGREVLKLRYAEALRPQAIAAKLGLAAGHVRVLLARVRQGLRDCIERRLAAGGRHA